MALFSLNLIVLIRLATGGYLLATTGMKRHAQTLSGIAFAVINAGLRAARLAKVSILCRNDRQRALPAATHQRRPCPCRSGSRIRLTRPTGA